MAQSLSVSGVEYIPALAAGKRFGYTREYILLLAREGKISAQKVGNRWFVDPKSVERFCEATRETVRARSAVVSQARKAELKARMVAARQARHSHQRAALIETVAIVFIGLMVGTMGYLSTPNQFMASAAHSDTSILERIAIALYSFVNPVEETVVRLEQNVVETETVESVDTAIMEVAAPAVTHVATVPHAASGVVVAPAVEFSANQAAEIARSFSDPVTVTPDAENPDTGIVVPHFRDGDGEAYRFLLVPLDADPNSNPDGG